MDQNLSFWYAVKVRTGGEIKVQRAIANKGYETFLPTHSEWRRYCDRSKLVQAALFPGYVFSRFDVRRRLPILTTVGVEAIVSIGGLPEPVNDLEISALQRVEALGVKAVPWPYLQEGEAVTIQHGSLTGISGILLKDRNIEQIILSIHLLGRSVSVQIDRSWIRPAQTRVIA